MLDRLLGHRVTRYGTTEVQVVREFREEGETWARCYTPAGERIEVPAHLVRVVRVRVK